MPTIRHVNCIEDLRRATSAYPNEYAPRRGSQQSPSMLRRNSFGPGGFAALTSGYALVGVWLSVGSGVVMGDALARVANAGYAINSRDPHLEAIGFVWNPLPTLAVIPFGAFRGLWPAVASYGVAGVFVSAACMAGAVVVLNRIARDLLVPTPARRVIVALFAIHPMIVFYGGNGMSEAMFVLLLLVVVRWLSLWLRNGSTGQLVGAALALAGAYLTRYEAFPVAVAVVALVIVVTWVRAPGNYTQRTWLAISDGFVAGMPFAAAVGLWAFASWMIVGSPFEQFTSNYGNAAFVAAATAEGAIGAGLATVATQLAALQPLGVVVIMAAVVVGWRSRQPTIAAALAVFAPVLGFAALSAIAGITFNFLRFYIALIPLVAIASLVVLARPSVALPTHWVRSTATVGVAMAMAMAIPATATAFWDRNLAPQEIMVAAAVDQNLRDRYPGLVPAFEVERQVARYLDALNLPSGSVLVDVLHGFAIVTASSDPSVFVIPSDGDFQTMLADPSAFGIQYILAVPDAGEGSNDAINQSYPTLFDGDADIAVLSGEFANLNAADPMWRLYRVTGP